MVLLCAIIDVYLILYLRTCRWVWIFNEFLINDLCTLDLFVRRLCCGSVSCRWKVARRVSHFGQKQTLLASFLWKKRAENEGRTRCIGVAWPFQGSATAAVCATAMKAEVRSILVKGDSAITPGPPLPLTRLRPHEARRNQPAPCTCVNCDYSSPFLASLYGCACHPYLGLLPQT